MPSSKPASPEMRCRTNSLINKPKNSLATNPPHPRPTQTIRPRHAPPLARPHPQSVGRRPAPMPLLQRHDEARPQGPPSRGNQKTPKACRRFGQESAQRVKGRGATLNQFFLRLHGLWEPERSGGLFTETHQDFVASHKGRSERGVIAGFLHHRR